MLALTPPRRTGTQRIQIVVAGPEFKLSHRPKLVILKAFVPCWVGRDTQLEQWFFLNLKRRALAELAIANLLKYWVIEFDHY